MLSIEGLSVRYGASHALRDVHLTVPSHAAVGLLGANGAGKTTLIKAVIGEVAAAGGSVSLDGHVLTRHPPHAIVRRHRLGIVPEGRRVFGQLSLEDNLRVGAYGLAAGRETAQRLDEVLRFFPALEERRSQLAGTLSGGEQQMLAIGRALMSRPSVLLLDEPSLGLAPIVIHAVGKIIRTLHEEGMTILLAEQNAQLALSVAGHCYVLENGSMLLDGPSHELRDDPRVQAAYLGGSG